MLLVPMSSAEVGLTNVLLCQGPHITGPWEIPQGDTLMLKAKLPMPSVVLIHVCAKPKTPPDQVNIVIYSKVSQLQSVMLQ